MGVAADEGLFSWALDRNEGRLVMAAKHPRDWNWGKERLLQMERILREVYEVPLERDFVGWDVATNLELHVNEHYVVFIVPEKMMRRVEDALVADEMTT